MGVHAAVHEHHVGDGGREASVLHVAGGHGALQQLVGEVRAESVRTPLLEELEWQRGSVVRGLLQHEGRCGDIHVDQSEHISVWTLTWLVVWYQPNSVQVCHSQGRNTKLTSAPFQAVVAMSWRLE